MLVYCTETKNAGERDNDHYYYSMAFNMSIVGKAMNITDFMGLYNVNVHESLLEIKEISP